MSLTRATSATMSLLALACMPTARPLVENVDACDFCRMVITDARFGGEALLRTGRVRTFDSIECLANYINAQTDSEALLEILVSDVDRGQLIPLADASFSRGTAGATPMGTGFVARRRDSSATGETLTWEEVLRVVREEPFHAPTRGADTIETLRTR